MNSLKSVFTKFSCKGGHFKIIRVFLQRETSRELTESESDKGVSIDVNNSTYWLMMKIFQPC